MSGNTGLNQLTNNSPGVIRRNNDRDGLGRNASVGGSTAAYRASLVSHYAEDLERRRRVERVIEDSRNNDRMMTSDT